MKEIIMKKEIKEYLVGKTINISFGGFIVDGNIIEANVLDNKVYIDIRQDDGLEDYDIELESYHITEYLMDTFKDVENKTDSGDLILAQTGYSDSKGVVVSYFDKKENCIKEDLYSNLVKSEDELDV
jgi:hypothetical protein